MGLIVLVMWCWACGTLVLVHSNGTDITLASPTRWWRMGILCYKHVAWTLNIVARMGQILHMGQRSNCRLCCGRETRLGFVVLWRLGYCFVGLLIYFCNVWHRIALGLNFHITKSWSISICWCVFAIHSEMACTLSLAEHHQLDTAVQLFGYLLWI